MKKVLAVIESEAMQAALQSALSRRYDLKICSDADAGAALLGEMPDAVIVDLQLPGTDGFCFLKQNRALLPRAVLVLSSFLSPSTAQKLAAIGVSAVIRIPCTVSHIAERLEIRIR